MKEIVSNKYHNKKLYKDCIYFWKEGTIFILLSIIATIIAVILWTNEEIKGVKYIFLILAAVFLYIGTSVIS